MDIYLPQRRVVIETKRTGEAHPDSVRDTETWETQFEQCQRYVQAEWERDTPGSTSTISAAFRGEPYSPMAASGGCGLGRYSQMAI